MSVPGQSWWQIVEDALLALIQEATNAGGVLAVQPNPDGTNGIKLVDKTDLPEQNVFPQIGVMMVSNDEAQAAIGTHDVVARYRIMISVRATMDPLNPVPSLRAVALEALRNYQNDAAGNGLEPLLRSQTSLQDYPGFQWGLITHVEREVVDNDASGADVVAVAVYTYEVHGQVRLWT